MIVLASGSPRRAQLLQQINVKFVQQVADIDESQKIDESADELVQRLAREKAMKVALRRKDSIPVLGSDTIGLLQGEVLVKPQDFQHFKELMRKMSGQVHKVLTAVALVRLLPESEHCDVREVTVSSDVTFKDLSESEISHYWGTGEPQDKAGGYAIQGLAGKFVKHINGSYSAIMGLPLYETAELIDSMTKNIQERSETQ